MPMHPPPSADDLFDRIPGQASISPSVHHASGSASASASASTSTSTSSQPHSNQDTDVGPSSNLHLLGPAPLKRNMACLSCRKRKLRCDAVKPVCGTCTKSRAAAAAANHPPPIPDGPCIYGDSRPERSDSASSLTDTRLPTTKRPTKRPRDSTDLPLSHSSHPDAQARISQLEAQVRHLESLLQSRHSASEPQIQAEILSNKHDFHATQTLGAQPSLPGFNQPDPLLDLLWQDCPPDLPSPDTIMHLSELFFASSPYRNLIYKPAYMAGLLLPPRHPSRPHPALIHAILAVSASLSPFFKPCTPPQSDRLGRRTNKNVEMIFGFSDPDFQPTPRTTMAVSFAEFHLAKARAKAETAL